MAKEFYPRPWWTRLWDRFKDLSPGQQAGWALGITISVVILTCTGFYIWSRFDASVNANSLIGLGGNVISAAIGGLVAVSVLLMTLDSENRRAVRERHQKLVDRRVEYAQELVDLLDVHPFDIDVLAQIKGVDRLIAKIDGTWLDQHEGRHIQIAFSMVRDVLKDADRRSKSDLSIYYGALAVPLNTLAKTLVREYINPKQVPIGYSLASSDASHVMQAVEELKAYEFDD